MRYPFAIMLLTLLGACKKDENTIGFVSKEGAVYETGPVLPEMRNVRHDTAFVVLYPNARVFYLDMKMKKSEVYASMIRSAQQDNLPVKVRVFSRTANPGGEEISEVYAPTAKEVDDFKASMHP